MELRPWLVGTRHEASTNIIGFALACDSCHFPSCSEHRQPRNPFVLDDGFQSQQFWFALIVNFTLVLLCAIIFVNWLGIFLVLCYEAYENEVKDMQCYSPRMHEIWWLCLALCDWTVMPADWSFFYASRYLRQGTVRRSNVRPRYFAHAAQCAVIPRGNRAPHRGISQRLRGVSRYSAKTERCAAVPRGTAQRPGGVPQSCSSTARSASEAPRHNARHLRRTAAQRQWKLIFPLKHYQKWTLNLFQAPPEMSSKCSFKTPSKISTWRNKYLSLLFWLFRESQNVPEFEQFQKKWNSCNTARSNSDTFVCRNLTLSERTADCRHHVISDSVQPGLIDREVLVHMTLTHAFHLFLREGIVWRWQSGNRREGEQENSACEKAERFAEVCECCGIAEKFVNAAKWNSCEIA